LMWYESVHQSLQYIICKKSWQTSLGINFSSRVGTRVDQQKY